MRRLLPAVLLTLTAAALPAVEYAPPEVYDLDRPALRLDVWNAEIAVAVDPAGSPLVQISRPAEAPPGDDGMRVLADAGEIIVHRLKAEEGADYPVRVKAVLTPDHSLHIEGRELAVTVDSAAGPQADEEEPDPARGPGEEDQGPGEVAPGGPGEAAGEGAAFKLLVAVAGSQVELTGVDGARLETTDSWVRTERTWGSLSLALTGGRADLGGHRGSLQLRVNDAEAAVADCRGPFNWILRGGSLEAVDGIGSSTGGAQGALLVFQRWRGPVSITANDSTAEVRAFPNPQAAVTLRGGDSHFVVDDLAGRLAAELAGGTLGARDLRGGAQIGARNGAEVELEEIRGKLVVELTGDSGAELNEARGDVVVTVRDARLWGQGIDRLAVTGEGSEITVGGVERLVRLEVGDSEVDLDLTGTRGDPAIELRGATNARVRLTAPCVVKVTGPQALMGTDVWVTGCELRTPEQGARAVAPIRRYGRAPRVLTARISEQTTLEVDGGQ